MWCRLRLRRLRLRADAIAGCGEGGLGVTHGANAGSEEQRHEVGHTQETTGEQEQEERDGSQPFHSEVGSCGQAPTQL